MRAQDIPASESSKNMITFRAPLARAMTTLDRSLFSKTVSLSAASVAEVRNLGKYRVLLGQRQEILSVPSVDVIRADPEQPGGKCLLLKPSIKANGMSLGPNPKSWRESNTGK